MFTTLGSTLNLTPNPSLLPRARSIRAAPPTHVMGRDNVVPPHYRYPAPKGASHTPTSPHQGVSTQASKQAGARGRRDHTAPPPQASAPTPRKRKHPKRTQPKRKHQTPTTRKQTRPQQVQPHTRKHFRAHATARGQARKCERKTVGLHPGMKQSRRNPHKGGHAGQAHTRRARKPRCLRRSGAALRPPDGGETRAKGRSQ